MAVQISRGLFNIYTGEVLYEVNISTSMCPHPHPFPPYPPCPPPMPPMPPRPLQGIQGPKGEHGAQGHPGIQGPKGIQGFVGNNGPQGIQGIQGIKGDRGPQGEHGHQGQKGDPGEPLKITGSVEDIFDLPITANQSQIWLVSDIPYVYMGSNKGDDDTPDHAWHQVTNITAIQGIQGPRGESIQGLQGESIQGEKGDSIQGIQGIQGPHGELDVNLDPDVFTEVQKNNSAVLVNSGKQIAISGECPEGGQVINHNLGYIPFISAYSEVGGKLNKITIGESHTSVNQVIVTWEPSLAEGSFIILK